MDTFAFSIFQEISFESTYKILCFGLVFIVFQVLSFLNERIYHRCSFETAGSCLLKYKFFMTFIVAF